MNALLKWICILKNIDRMLLRGPFVTHNGCSDFFVSCLGEKNYDAFRHSSVFCTLDDGALLG